jgi:protoporphyrin/coproporphyrin ferrochelatase
MSQANKKEGKTALLLINLGSPDSPSVPDVRKYLKEFLLDGNVIDVPAPLRHLIVRGFILPFRPKKSAEAYQSIWWEEGSPLIALSKRFHQKVAAKMDEPVYLAMRYGNPSIKNTLQQIYTEHPDLQHLIIVPLYPQYAMATTKTVLEKVEEELKNIAPTLKTSWVKPFYNDPNYLFAQAEVIKNNLPKDIDHVLFSFHGIPVRHVKKTDPTKAHCYKVDDCCNVENKEAHAFCYAHQCKDAMHKVAEILNLEKGKYSFSFQSRLGRDPWLLPFTEPELERLAKSGVKKIAVTCPAFVTDCLETLEEMGDRGREVFKEHGGEEFVLLPCMNDSDVWVDAFVRMMKISPSKEG